MSFEIRFGSRDLTPCAEQGFATSTEPSLKDTLAKVIPAKRELLKQVKSHAAKNIGSVKVENTLGGMRYVCPCSSRPSLRAKRKQRSYRHDLGMISP